MYKAKKRWQKCAYSDDGYIENEQTLYTTSALYDTPVMVRAKHFVTPLAHFIFVRIPTAIFPIKSMRAVVEVLGQKRCNRRNVTGEM